MELIREEEHSREQECANVLRWKGANWVCYIKRKQSVWIPESEKDQ